MFRETGAGMSLQTIPENKFSTTGFLNSQARQISTSPDRLMTSGNESQR